MSQARPERPGSPGALRALHPAVVADLGERLAP